MPPKRARDSDESVAPDTEGAFLWAGTWRAPLVKSRRADSRSRLPAVGDVVTVRVMRIQPRLATVDILCVGESALREACTGLIRREDVRPIGGEPVEVYRSFRPGDIVLARVLSLGDARAYYLTSSEPELGVVLARSSEGAIMTPVSWKEMECPQTKAREPRKCAKPRQAVEAEARVAAKAAPQPAA